jgi:hypothetical protein
MPGIAAERQQADHGNDCDDVLLSGCHSVFALCQARSDSAPAEKVA